MHKLRKLFASSSAVATIAAQAHEGHGLPGASHWHATDTAGLLLVGGLAAIALWFWIGGGRK